MNAEPGQSGPSPVYARVPETVSSTCELLLGEFAAGHGVRLASELMEVLRGTDAALFAEALALDLAARPDIRDLMRIFATDPLPGGAETRTEWSLLPGAPALVRLSIDCLEPVLVRFALAFDLDRHGEVLREAARTDHVLVVGREPGSGAAGQEHPPALIVPHNGQSLARLLAHVAAG